MPRSDIQVLAYIAASGGATQREIRTNINLARRTIHKALRALMADNIVREYPYLRDTRQRYYRVVMPQ